MAVMGFGRRGRRGWRWVCRCVGFGVGCACFGGEGAVPRAVVSGGGFGESHAFAPRAPGVRVPGGLGWFVVVVALLSACGEYRRAVVGVGRLGPAGWGFGAVADLAVVRADFSASTPTVFAWCCGSCLMWVWGFEPAPAAVVAVPVSRSCVMCSLGEWLGVVWPPRLRVGSVEMCCAQWRPPVAQRVIGGWRVSLYRPKV